MPTFICDQGHEHPITQETWDLIDMALGDGPINSDRAKARVRSMLNTSEVRQLTDFERMIIRGCDAVVNINRALRVMHDRCYKEVFGPDACVDQIHGNRVTKDCGCILTHLFDHHKRHDPNRELHAHFPENICEKHWKIVRTDKDGRFNFKHFHAAVLKDA